MKLSACGMVARTSVTPIQNQWLRSAGTATISFRDRDRGELR